MRDGKSEHHKKTKGAGLPAPFAITAVFAVICFRSDYCRHCGQWLPTRPHAMTWFAIPEGSVVSVYSLPMTVEGTFDARPVSSWVSQEPLNGASLVWAAHALGPPPPEPQRQFVRPPLVSPHPVVRTHDSVAKHVDAALTLDEAALVKLPDRSPHSFPVSPKTVSSMQPLLKRQV